MSVGGGTEGDSAIHDRGLIGGGRVIRDVVTNVSGCVIGGLGVDEPVVEAEIGIVVIGDVGFGGNCRGKRGPVILA